MQWLQLSSTNKISLLFIFDLQLRYLLVVVSAVMVMVEATAYIVVHIRCTDDCHGGHINTMKVKKINEAGGSRSEHQVHAWCSLKQWWRMLQGKWSMEQKMNACREVDSTANEKPELRWQIRQWESTLIFSSAQIMFHHIYICIWCRQVYNNTKNLCIIQALCERFKLLNYYIICCTIFRWLPLSWLFLFMQQSFTGVFLLISFQPPFFNFPASFIVIGWQELWLNTDSSVRCFVQLKWSVFHYFMVWCVIPSPSSIKITAVKIKSWLSMTCCTGYVFG